MLFPSATVFTRASLLVALCVVCVSMAMPGMGFANSGLQSTDYMADAAKTDQGKAAIAQGKNPFVDAFRRMHAENHAEENDKEGFTSASASEESAKKYVEDVKDPSHSDKLFRKCLCWNNETNSFCNGKKWYNSDACQEWLQIALAWSLPAIILFFFFFLFPIFFCCSRMICNCCGGRNPSYGCCCPETHTEHRFPGYSNRTIFFAKFLFMGCFGFLIYFSVGAIVTNVRVHSSLTSGLTLIGNIANHVETELVSVRDAYELFAQNPMPYSFTPESDDIRLADTAAVIEAQTVVNRYSPRVHDLHDVLHHIRHAEHNHHSYGRFNIVFDIVGYTLLFYLILFIMSCCGRCHGCCTSIFVLLISWCGMLVVCMFLFHMVWAQGAVAVCDNFNTTMKPVVSQLRSSGGCGVDNTARLTLVGERFMNVITNPQSDICSSYITPLCSSFENDNAFHCPATNPCRASKNPGYPYTVPNSTIPNQYNVKVFETLLKESSLSSHARLVREDSALSGISILDCASQCPHGSNTQRSAAALKRVYEKFYTNVSFITNSALPDAYECTYINDILRGSVHHILCDRFSRWSTNLAIQAAAMSGIIFISLYFIVKGIKRFRRFGSREKIADVALRSVYAADAALNGMETPASPIVPVTPLDNNQQPGYGATDETNHNNDHHQYHAYTDNDQANVQAIPLMQQRSMQERYYPSNASMVGRPAHDVAMEGDALESKP